MFPLSLVNPYFCHSLRVQMRYEQNTNQIVLYLLGLLEQRVMRALAGAFTWELAGSKIA